MTADLAEEHDTATHATEMLEAETADRMRLDKELKDVQVSSYLIMFEPWLQYNVECNGLRIVGLVEYFWWKVFAKQVCNKESKIF